jgi:hypothetical protein
MLGIVDSQMVGDYELDQGMSALEVLDEHLDEGSTVHWGWSHLTQWSCWTSQ